MNQCRLEKGCDCMWYPLIGMQWGERILFTVLFIRGAKTKLLRFRHKQNAQEVIDKWVAQGMEQLPDIYSLQFNLKNNLKSDFSI